MGKRDGVAFLHDILPYLMVKEEQALFAVEFGGLTKPGTNGYTIDANEFAIREAYKQAITEAKYT